MSKTRENNSRLTKLKSLITGVARYSKRPIIKLSTWALSLHLAAITVIGFTSLAHENTNTEDIGKYKIADNLEELFNGLSQSTINWHSEIHDVVPVQTALKLNGYNIGSCDADGIYGNTTAKAIHDFQTDHCLPPTGTANSNTLKMLFRTSLANTVNYNHLDSIFIRPYQNEKAQDILSNFEYLSSRRRAMTLIARPDITLTSQPMVFLSDRKEVTKNHFQGCGNNHLRDCFRHSYHILEVSKISFGTSGARKIMDFRERLNENPFPSTLMDYYNHAVAEDMYDDYQDGKYDDIKEAILDYYETGKLAKYPFPLVPINQPRAEI